LISPVTLLMMPPTMEMPPTPLVAGVLPPA
jgi:hypothetical protein